MGATMPVSRNPATNVVVFQGHVARQNAASGRAGTARSGAILLRRVSGLFFHVIL